jgi:hypothetical protein
MLVTESGMVTDCKDEQPQNALPPMLVTESGMVKKRHIIYIGMPSI